jgi:hypothetical protein
MNNKSYTFSILIILLLISTTSLSVMGQKITYEKKFITNNQLITKTVEKIQITVMEIKQLFDWCNSIKDIKLQKEIRQSLKQTINSNGELYVKILQKKLDLISKRYDIENVGILPAVAIVRCKWEITSDSAGERTIHFWIFGFGRHKLLWDTLDDFDGDGIWDLGPGSPWEYEWIAFFFPLRHFSDWASWSGFPGRAKVKVDYELDGNTFTKTFQEPTNDLQYSQSTELSANPILNQPIVQNKIIQRPVLCSFVIYK